MRSHFCLMLVCWVPFASANDAKFDGPNSKRSYKQNVVFDDQQMPSDKMESTNANERYGIYLPPNIPNRLVIPPVIIEMSPENRLTVRPSEAVILSFEIINYTDAPQGVVFSATDIASLIRFVDPPSTLIAPRGSTRVKVEIFPATESAVGLVNTVTLAGQLRDGSYITRSAHVRIAKEIEDDGWDPTCSFTVQGGQCREQHSQESCMTGGWNVEATFRDDLSGLLRIESSPPGSLVFPPKFTAGTRSPVSVVLASSCCNEKMTVKVWDANGNSRTCDVAVYGLLAGEIAAIVLGCILLLALIAIIVMAIMLCRRRRAHELARIELPPRRRSP
ncbi:uncharacterized protein LOC135939254 [Cloeon dipterum]|uniref:uncharacterized protein LOC135939254 n=1 Tax=Cloeon dipterum TaxID=197152 RepID=UPI00321FC4B4